MKGRIGRLFVCVVVLACTIGVATAAADNGSSQSGYGGSAGSIQAEVQQSGGLPFTGLDITLLVVGGLLLAALGVLLRRTARKST